MWGAVRGWQAWARHSVFHKNFVPLIFRTKKRSSSLCGTERSALHLVAGRLLRQGPDREAPQAWGTGKGFQRGLELGDFGLRK